MIVDASALLAILLEEPDAEQLSEALAAGNEMRMSAANYMEAAIVTDANGDPNLSGRFDRLVEAAGIIIEPVSDGQARIARQAYRNFGKGSGHRAGLNFGDCFAYALARTTGEPLLSRGTDFAATDVEPALP